MSSLPSPDPAAEDALVLAWAERDDPDGLVDLVSEAMDARRVALAARLVQLLPDELDDHPALARARLAAGLALHRRLGPESASWSEFEDAWRELRTDRVARARLRQRRRLAGDDRPVRRLDARRSRRGR